MIWTNHVGCFFQLHFSLWFNPPFFRFSITFKYSSIFLIPSFSFFANCGLVWFGCIFLCSQILEGQRQIGETVFFRLISLTINFVRRSSQKWMQFRSTESNIFYKNISKQVGLRLKLKFDHFWRIRCLDDILIKHSTQVRKFAFSQNIFSLYFVMNDKVW